MTKILIYLYASIGAIMALVLFLIVTVGYSKLEVHFLNIGQGDAIFLRLPTWETILIDGGPDGIVLQEISTVLPFYERTIDLMVLSHPHADHVNGLIDVFKQYNVKQVLITGVKYHDAGYQEFLDLLANSDNEIVFINGYKDYRFGPVVIDMLYPFESIQGKRFENLNNSSIAFRVIYGESAVFLSGDLEGEGEKEILLAGLDVEADLFKAGHHGSRTSNSSDLIAAMDPTYAVIMCGIENSFSHPHAETVQKLQLAGIKIFRTDLDGRISFEVSKQGEVHPINH